MIKPVTDSKRSGVLVKFAVVAVFFALLGLADAAYLTSKHLMDTQVSCNITTGCERVLTSSYAEIFGIPTAALGLIAYFAAFSSAILTYFNYRKTWFIFGALSGLMAFFSLWLVYLQAFVIGAFCQFCLLSAATSLMLFFIFLVSKIIEKFPKNQS